MRRRSIIVQNLSKKIIILILDFVFDLPQILLINEIGVSIWEKRLHSDFYVYIQYIPVKSFSKS